MKQLLIILLLLNCPTVNAQFPTALMNSAATVTPPSYTTINAVTYSGGGGTSGSMSTVNANLIVITVAYYSAGGSGITVSDNKGNAASYVRRVLQADAGGQGCNIAEYDCIGCTVGGGHNFTVTGTGDFISFTVRAYKNATATPVFDVAGSFNATSVTGASYTMSAGTVTASVGSELIVIGGNLAKASAAPTIDNSFTSPAPDFTGYSAGVNYGVSASYKLSGSSGSNTANFIFNPQAGISATGVIICYK